MAAPVITITSASRVGDLVTVNATADGQPVTVTCWFSHLTTLPTLAAKLTYLKGLVQQANPAPVDLAISG